MYQGQWEPMSYDPWGGYGYGEEYGMYPGYWMGLLTKEEIGKEIKEEKVEDENGRFHARRGRLHALITHLWIFDFTHVVMREIENPKQNIISKVLQNSNLIKTIYRFLK